MDSGRLFHRIQGGRAGGFTLIEMMVAMAVLSIGLLALFKLHFASTGANTVSRAVTESSIFASAKAEQLLALPYDHPDLSAGAHQPGMDQDGIDNNMNALVDESGENGGATLRWDVVEDCLGADFQGHKCVHLRLTSDVNNKRSVETRLDFVKTPM